MAQDDYHVIVYRVLVYLYACMKHKIMFEGITFQEAVKKNVESDEYFTEVLQLMQEEELIRGLAFINAWGGDVMLACDVSEAKITAKGIRYLEDNDKMKKIGKALKDAVDTIAKLAVVVGLLV